jgi:pimeloyl-ACP methyl ester carboxylesterase
MAASIASHDLRDVVAVGHSFGAVMSLVAAARHPGRFRALALLDPTMVMSDQLDQIFFLDANGDRQHHLAVKARERRAQFASEEEAFAAWRPKTLFCDWSDEALRQFVRSALRPADQGSGMTLAWSPAWEAHYYEAFYYDSWAELERLDPRISVLVVRGGDTDVFQQRSVARFRAIRPSARMVDVPGYGHLFPQAAPVETARILGEWLAGLGRRIDG